MKSHDSLFFNPINTVYFTSVEEHTYRVGKDLWRILSQCGKVNRMYFVKEKIFVEFEEESSIELFSRYGFRANFFKEFMEQNANKSGTNDISTSVLCSLKAGQTRKGSRYLQKRLRFFNHGFVEKIPRDRINEK